VGVQINPLRNLFAIQFAQTVKGFEMYQLTEQQKAFIEAYSQSICECPKNLLIKYFEDSEKFGRTYREYYSNIEDCYSVWVMALEYANKTVKA
jgi:hypothetical protein